MKLILFLCIYFFSFIIQAQTVYNPFTRKLDFVATGSGGGDITGAANAGAGTSVFYQKSGNTLQFNGVKSANSGIVVTLDAGTHDVTLTFTAANVNLADLNGNLAQSRITNLVSDLAAKVPTSRQIICGSTITGCGDLSADRTLNVINDTNQQRVGILKGGSLIGTRQSINFIEGANTTLTVADNSGSNRVDVTVASSGAGTSYTPSTYCIPSISSDNLLISTPCKVLVGTQELTFGSNITFDGTSGTGVVLIGVQDGVVKAWHNVTASCTNCTAVGSTSLFPPDACALASATVTAGVVSAPINLREGRSCESLQSDSGGTILVTSNPTTGVKQASVVLNGNAGETTFSGGVLALDNAVRVPTCADAGSTDAYACSASPAPTAYVTGGRYVFKANTANTGAATVNFNSLGAKTIKKFTSASPGADLADNDIRAGQWVHLIYDGTNMQMVSALGNAGSGGATVTNRTILETYWCMAGNSSRPIPWTTFTFTGMTETVVSSTNWYGRCGLEAQITAATDNGFFGWRMNGSGATSVNFTDMPAGGITNIVVEIKSPSISTTDVFIRADGASDLGSGPADSPANTVGFRRLSGGNWFVQWCVASSCSTADTGVAMSTSTIYRLTLQIPQSGDWTWKIESGNTFSTVNTGTAAGTKPSTSLLPILHTRNDGAIQPTFTAYYYHHFITLP